MLVCKDEITKMKFAHICERQGATEKWVIEKILEDINRLGYTEVILESTLLASSQVTTLFGSKCHVIVTLNP